MRTADSLQAGTLSCPGRMTAPGRVLDLVCLLYAVALGADVPRSGQKLEKCLKWRSWARDKGRLRRKEISLYCVFLVENCFLQSSILLFVDLICAFG